MSVAKAQSYNKCIEPIMAQEALAQLPIITFPHMKKQKAKEIEKKLKKTADISFKDAPKDTKELYHHLLRTLGNG